MISPYVDFSYFDPRISSFRRIALVWSICIRYSTHIDTGRLPNNDVDDQGK